MSVTQKTTVYLDAADYHRLKVIARQQGRKPAELVREAVAAYTRRSGKRDLSERAEQLLAGLGRHG
jgi:predicted DNA-binding protein